MKKKSNSRNPVTRVIIVINFWGNFFFLFSNRKLYEKKGNLDNFVTGLSSVVLFDELSISESYQKLFNKKKSIKIKD